MAVLAAQAELAQTPGRPAPAPAGRRGDQARRAEAEKVRILAQADARRVTLQAEAAASHNRSRWTGC